MSLIACYCEENQRARLESVLGPNARCSSNWRSFEAAAAGAYCVVVARQWMSDTAFVEPLRALRASIPSAPFVIVTDSSVENLTLLGRVGFDRLVQFDRLAEELPAAVHEFVDEKPRAWLIRAVSNLEPLPEGFRAGLIEELRRDRPPTTVKGLARLMGWTPDALDHWWRRAGRESHGLTQLVDHILLLRALELRAASGSFKLSALELGIGYRRLRRIVSRGQDDRDPSESSPSPGEIALRILDQLRLER